MKKVDVIIPTYHPGQKFKNTLQMLRCQTYPVRKIIIINTEKALFDERLLLEEGETEGRHPAKTLSGDAWRTDADVADQSGKPGETVTKTAETGMESAAANATPEIEIVHISASEFDHGRSRNLGMQMSDADYCLSMTDDAIPANAKLVETLVSVLERDPEAGAVYARQLATKESSLDEQYSRIFNYPETSCRKTIADVPKLGIKTFFESNVCCLYRKALFDRLGGFIDHTIFNEDMIYCHKMLHAGYASVYCAEAAVYHAHHYSGLQQLHRNFDLGISQADHPEVFSGIRSEGEGLRMVKGCIAWLVRSGHGFYIPEYIYKTGMKYLGYRLGKAYRRLPEALVKTLTMNKNYFV